MKRLSQILATVAVAVLVPLTLSSSASAVATCDVGFTGPNSQNMCTSVEKYECSVENNNTVDIKNTTNQSGYSGPIEIGNTTGAEGAASGSVTNTNGTTFLVTITNDVPCMAAVVVPAVETPEVVQPTKPVASNGGGAVSGGAGAIRALPVTSGDPTVSIATVVAGIVALLAALTASGVLAYRHFRAS